MVWENWINLRTAMEICYKNEKEQGNFSNKGEELCNAPNSLKQFRDK